MKIDNKWGRGVIGLLWGVRQILMNVAIIQFDLVK